MKIARQIACAVSMCCMLVGVVVAEDSPAKREADLTKVTPAVKLVRSQLDDLLTRMIQVAAAVEKTDPESARAIRDAAQTAQKAAVTQSVDEVLAQLNQNLSKAHSTQLKIQQDLDDILQALHGQKNKEKYIPELEAIRGELAAARETQTGLIQPGTEGKGADKDPAKTLDGQQKLTGDLGNVQQQMKDLDAKTGEVTPGGDHVAGAKAASGKAADGMAQGKGDQATSSQKKVVSEIDKAIEEIDSRLARLEEERQEDQLASLDSLLTAVLESQKEYTIATRDAYTKRDSQQKYDRKQEQRLTALGDGEQGLAEKVAQALKMLENEKLKVFPAVLGDVKAKLLEVGRNLHDRQAGELTQASQREIEQTLSEIVKSLRDNYRERLAKKTHGPTCTPPNNDGQPPQPGPLVPPLAELKLLLSLQVHVGSQTQQLNGQVASMEPSISTAEHRRLSGQEKMILKLADDMRNKTTTSEPK